MCGIHFCVYHQSGEEIRQSECLERRGPDALHCEYASLSSQLRGYACGCVLWMRGVTCAHQPIVTARGDIFLWNGNCFGGYEIPTSKSDTEYLSDALAECESAEAVCAVLSGVCGPYAFIFWHAASRCLWLGRDYFGRRCLLWNVDTCVRLNCLVLSSVCLERGDDIACEMTEVPCSGFFSVHIPQDATSLAEASFCLYPWSRQADTGQDRPIHCSVAPSIYLKPPVDTTLNRCEPPSDSTVHDQMAEVSLDVCSQQAELIAMRERFERVLLEAVDRRVFNAPRLCRNCVRKQRNVSGSNSDSGRIVSDSGDGRVGSKSGSTPCSDSVSASVCRHARLAVLFSGGVDSAALAAAAHKCLTEVRKASGDASNNNSGVVIDLLNVAFVDLKTSESGSGSRSVSSSVSSHRSGVTGSYTAGGEGKGLTACGVDGTLLDQVFFAGGPIAKGVPDRVAGLACWHQLRQAYPQTTWNFVQIDVTSEELCFWRDRVISRLISPQNSIIDDSIGCALWFAARGSGVLAGTNEVYSSPARVVLVGMGADEQLGGYGRHRAAFAANSWRGLNDEIAKQVAEISHRNLGRDDRVISYHGVEARYPYLDESVVEYLCAEPAWLKTRLSPACTRHAVAPGGIDKLPVRLLALHYQLKESAALTKRAIQFGSRIAKVGPRPQIKTTATKIAAGTITTETTVAGTTPATETTAVTDSVLLPGTTPHSTPTPKPTEPDAGHSNANDR